MQLIKGAALATTILCCLLLLLTFTGAEWLFTQPALYIALLFAVILLGLGAIFGHPDTRMRGGEGNLSWRDLLRSAPPWTIGLFGLSILVMLVCVLLLPEVRGTGPSSFSVLGGDLAGRSDRWRVLLSSFMAMSACWTAAAASAIRRREAWMRVP